jgi:hypothetical protein
VFLYSESKTSSGHAQSDEGGGSSSHTSKSSLDDPRPYLGHTSLLAPTIKSEPSEHHQFNKTVRTTTSAPTTAGTGVHSSSTTPNHHQHHHHQINNHQIFGFPPLPTPVAPGSAGDVSSYVMGHHSAHHHHHHLHHHHMTAAKLMATT